METSVWRAWGKTGLWLQGWNQPHSAWHLLDGAPVPLYNVWLGEPRVLGFTLGPKGCAESGPPPVPTKEQASQGISPASDKTPASTLTWAKGRTSSD